MLWPLISVHIRYVNDNSHKESYRNQESLQEGDGLLPVGRLGQGRHHSVGHRVSWLLRRVTARGATCPDLLQHTAVRRAGGQNRGRREGRLQVTRGRGGGSGQGSEVTGWGRGDSIPYTEL